MFIGAGYLVKPKFSFGEKVGIKLTNYTDELYIKNIRVVMKEDGEKIYSYDIRMDYVDPGYGLDEKKSKIVTDVDEEELIKL